MQLPHLAAGALPHAVVSLAGEEGAVLDALFQPEEVARGVLVEDANALLAVLSWTSSRPPIGWPCRSPAPASPCGASLSCASCARMPVPSSLRDNISIFHLSISKRAFYTSWLMGFRYMPTTALLTCARGLCCRPSMWPAHTQRLLSSLCRSLLLHRVRLNHVLSSSLGHPVAVRLMRNSVNFFSFLGLGDKAEG